ncbi:MAG TPA: hypothetical protein VJ962_04995 [Clostridia bacterium]|nr:hypothetical protein [Clostridia bacterium]
MKKTRKYIVIAVAILLIGLVLVKAYEKQSFKSAYKEKSYKESQNYLDNSPESEKEYIVDENAYEAFTENYLIDNLVKEVGYTKNNEFNLSFYFNEKATREDIETAKSTYGMMFFGEIKISYVPYIEVLYNRNDFENIVLRVFSDEKLVIYKKYNFNKLEEVYYENLDIQLFSRKIDHPSVDTFVNETLSILDGSSVIEGQKPFKPYVYHFKIITDDKVSMDEVSQVKNLVENDLGPVLEKESLEIFGRNENALGIVLAFETLEEEYLELLYFNGKDKEWLNEDWMTIDFFLRNQ